MDSVAELAGCSTVLLCLPTVDEISQTLANLAPELAAGSTVVSLSTVTPDQARRLARQCADHDCRFVDAPVARSTVEARQGQLIIMLGAPDREPMVPDSVLWDLAEEIFYCGDVGAGSAMKLVNNLCNQAILFVTEEAFLFGEAVRLPRELIFEVLSSTNANNGHLQRTVQQKVFTGDFAPGFPARLSHKDLNLAAQSAYRAHVPIPVSAAALQATSMCVAAGHGDDDSSVYHRVLEEQTGMAGPSAAADD